MGAVKQPSRQIAVALERLGANTATPQITHCQPVCVIRRSVSGSGRASLNGNKTAEPHAAGVSNQSTSAKSEPAISTLLTPSTAKYHKYRMASPGPEPRRSDPKGECKVN